MDARQAYLESRILTADSLELVRILYRGASDAVENARKSLAQGDVMERGRHISRALEVLIELAMSLNHDQGGGLARNLAGLYDYMQRRLLDAQFQQVEAPLVEVAQLLNLILEGWQRCRPPAVAPAAPPEALYNEPTPEYVPLSCSG